MGSASRYLATVPTRPGMRVTTSAAVNGDSRVIAMAPPMRMAMLCASVPNVPDRSIIASTGRCREEDRTGVSIRPAHLSSG